MAQAKVRANAPNRLIVEGRDDKWSILALTQLYGWDWDNPQGHYPYIDDAEGVDNAVDALPVSVRTYKRVGIVVDADTDQQRRWDGIKSMLDGVGFTLPPTPIPDGTVVSKGDKRVGVWLMPNNQSPGKLEDFLAVLIPSRDGCWGWADEATKGAAARGALFTESDFIKARIHAWLAWQREPGLPFGTAITAALFSHQAALAEKFVQWVAQLYSD
jgi:hypothetical protein